MINHRSDKLNRIVEHINVNIYLPISWVLKRKTDQTLLWTCLAGAHKQCVNNQYARFENKGMKTVGVTDYTQITKFKHPKGGVHAIMPKFNTLKNIMKKVNKQCLLDTPRTVRVSEKTWQVNVRTRRP